MNTKRWSNWAGLISILWMVGGFVLLASLGPHLDHYELALLYRVELALAWLVGGLVFAIAGLMEGNRVGRVSAGIAILVFIFFVWLSIVPAFKRSHQRAERFNARLGPAPVRSSIAGSH
jgi:hypothetical protein